MGETIRLTAADGVTISAYRARPKGDPKGGVVVVQEIFGVNDHIRAVADGFAADGYEAIAPAIFDRVETGVEVGYDEPGFAKGREVRAKAGGDKPLLDITAAVTALPGKVGVVGYCWGGSLAWLSATRLDGIACAIGYYGGQIAQFKDETPRCPVILHFGETDKSIPMSDVEAIAAAHPEVPIYIYPAGHGFNCDRRADYHPDSARMARQRTIGFLGENIR